MKTILVFCINLLIVCSAYAELSRKDLVSYTLDFYLSEGKAGEKKSAQQKEKPSEEAFSKAKPGIAAQPKSSSKKADKAALARKKKIEKVLQVKSQKADIAVPLKQKANYGTKLSFDKATDKSKDKSPSVAGKEVKKKESQEQNAADASIEKPNYASAILKNTHPYIVAVGAFDDNIYHVKGNETYDYVSKIMPGFEIKSKTPKKSFDAYLNAGAEILRYAKTSKNDTESPFGSGFVKYGFGKVGLLTAVDAKRFRSTPSDLADDEIGEFLDYWRYQMSQDLKLNFNRLEVDLQYNRAVYGYEDEQFKSSNRTRDVIALRNSVKIFPKTKLFLEYAHGWADYYKNPTSDFSYDRPIIGLNGKILRKLDATIKIGYNFNKRKNLKDLNGTLFYSMLTYKYSPRLYYNLIAVKSIGSINLISEGISKYQGASIGCSYLPPALKKLRLTSSVGYWQRGSDYQSRDKHWQVSFRPEYKFRDWLLFGLGYYFENRSSKDQVSDYRDNRIEMSVVSEF